MRNYLGYISALEFWRSNHWAIDPNHGLPQTARETIYTPRKGRAKDKDFYSAHSAQADELGRLCNVFGIESRPIDVIVSSLDQRRPSATLMPHVWKQLPRGSFMRLSKNVFVSSPEACFLQLATKLSLVGLIQLGFELTGSYALDPTSEIGIRYDVPQLTTTSKIKRYLDRCEGLRGTLKAKRALKHIVDRSASPMETNLAMLLCLPSSLGGFGLSKPVLNFAIAQNKSPGNRGTVSPKSQSHPVKEFRLDLYWPKHRFALEYDSDSFHSTVIKLHADAQRRTSLEKLGIHVISVTSNQVYDAMLFESLAHVTARHIGKRIRITRNDFRTRTQSLRTQILETQGTFGPSGK